jgi:uncharacterized protein (TIGR02145 family)
MKTSKTIYLLATITIVFTYALFSGCKKKPELPTVTTGEITHITDISAIGSGEVTKDGNSDVTLKGVCWSKSPEPTILNFFMNSTSTGVGSFSCNIIALQASTEYHVRAFAINEVGTAYGNTVTFTSLPPEILINAPVVSTAVVSTITSSTAVCGGIVTSDAGSTVTARGVCWSQNSSPTIADSKTNNGSGAGSFTSNITGLSHMTTYFVRAYATNANGTGYGSTMSFTTQSSLPSVTTAEISEIIGSTAISGGTVTSDGGSTVTERGVCWSTSQNPTTSNLHTTDGSGTGSFTSNITGLSGDTTYYVRAYATNSVGTVYGIQRSFTTLNDFCEGFTAPTGYGIVSSSGKCWLDRNLGATQVATYYAYGHLYQWGRGTDEHQIRTSFTSPTLSNSDTPGHGNFITISSSPGDWRSPKNDNLWQGASGINNPCPDGWRIPTETEWNAERLSWSSNNAAGAFASPLKLPVAGSRNHSNGSLFNVGSSGYYWSSTVDGTRTRFLYFNSSDADMFSYYRANGVSVRCLKDLDF